MCHYSHLGDNSLPVPNSMSSERVNLWHAISFRVIEDIIQVKILTSFSILANVVILFNCI